MLARVASTSCPYLSGRESLAEKIAALQTELAELDATSRTHYRAALDGGWTAKELAAASLTVPKSTTRRRAANPRRAASAAPPRVAG